MLCTEKSLNKYIFYYHQKHFLFPIALFKVMQFVITNIPKCFSFFLFVWCDQYFFSISFD